MYDTAKKSRAANKAKAERLANRPIERVDSSDWTPPPLLNADVKTGMRPVSKQALKRGGKVHGSAPKARADRMARKAGGRVEEKGEQPLVDRYVNRDLKKANEYRDGEKHEGALKRGGRAKKADGGSMSMEEMIKKNPAPEKKPEFKMPNPVPVPPRRQEEAPKFKKDTDLNTQSYKKGGSAKLSKGTKNARAKHAAGGKVHSDAAEDKAMIKSMVKPSALKGAACYGGRMKKADGGSADPRMNIVKPKALEFGSNMVTPGLKKGGRAAKAFGGPMGAAMPAAMGSGVAPTMPVLPAQAMANAQGIPMQGGSFMPPGLANRPAMPLARAAGGRTKGKGKTNINIVIAQAPKEQDGQAQVPPMGGPAPGGIPVPVPPAGGAPQMGAAPMPPMPPMPQQGGAPRPSPFKKGGRVTKVAHSFKDMEAGAGSGEGRLQKTDIAKRAPHKAGGKVYRSYKDMDAGSGSGMGRLEKTEIEAHKSRKG